MGAGSELKKDSVVDCFGVAYPQADTTRELSRLIPSDIAAKMAGQNVRWFARSRRRLAYGNTLPDVAPYEDGGGGQVVFLMLA
jgi:hypothetical protein